MVGAWDGTGLTYMYVPLSSILGRHPFVACIVSLHTAFALDDRELHPEKLQSQGSSNPTSIRQSLSVTFPAVADYAEQLRQAQYCLTTFSSKTTES